MEITAENIAVQEKSLDKLKVNRLSYKLTPPVFQLLADIIAIVLSIFLQHYIRYYSGYFGHIKFDFDIWDYFIVTSLLLIYWLTIFWFSGLYKDWYIRSPFDEMFTVIRAIFLGTFIMFFFLFLDGTSNPRRLFLLYFILITVNVLIGRFTVKKIQKILRVKRKISLPSIIVGNFNKAAELFEKTEKSPAWGFKVVGMISTDDNIDISETKAKNLNILGKYDATENILDNLKPKEVLITMDIPERNILLNLASYCAQRKINVKIVPDLYDFFTGRARTFPVYGIPLIDINTQLLKPWEEAIKRFLDLVISLIVIICGLPLWLLISIIIKLESKGPIFYKQERVGKDGKKFMMIKFRSMVQDAEKHGPRWTAVGDPRVTKFGYFLRKSHLDEVPQFLNVLLGDMSLVGPRPERPVFVDKFSKLVPYYNRRLVVRPGITGWWQVNYKTYEESKEEIENRLKDDFYYIENMSIRLDFEILVRTVYCVLKGHGQA